MKIFIRTQLVLVGILIIVVAVNLALTLDIRGRLTSSPTPSLTEWNAEDWARKAIALDGRDEIDPAQISRYIFAMDEAAQHCHENSEVLDQLIEAVLFNTANTAPTIRLKTLLEFSTLSGTNDCSDILPDTLMQLSG